MALSKTVNVQPAELLPTNARGRPNQKRVDYTFSVELPDEGKTFSLMKSMMIKQDVDIWSLCQTDYPSLASRSLFAHLEIKRRFAGTDGEIQMGIWSAAGFRKLHSLLIERNRAVTNAWSKLPVMPMWLVEGETWKLYVSSQQFAERVIVYGPFILWKTTSAQSVVGLILSLVAVMDWGIQHYLPWFLETIAYNQI